MDKQGPRLPSQTVILRAVTHSFRFYPTLPLRSWRNLPKTPSALLLQGVRASSLGVAGAIVSAQTALRHSAFLLLAGNEQGAVPIIRWADGFEDDGCQCFNDTL